MKLLNGYGERIFDYAILTIIILLSSITVIPLYFVYVGIIGYFDAENKKLITILLVIKANFRLISMTNLVILIFLLTSLFNITHVDDLNNPINVVILWASIIVLMLGIILILYSPILIINMNVSIKQLFQNVLVMTVKFPFNTLILILLIGIFIYLSTNNSFLFILATVFIYQMIHYISKENLRNMQINKK